jgi:hypothetical protein
MAGGRKGEAGMKRVRFRGTKNPAVKPEEAETEVSQDTHARVIFREEQRHDKEKATAEYLAQQEATRKKTERLRAAREAREAKSNRAEKAKAKQ